MTTINQPTPQEDWQNGTQSAANTPAADVRHDASVNADTRNPLPVDRTDEDAPVVNPNAPEFTRHEIRTTDENGAVNPLTAAEAYRADNESLADAQRAASDES